MKDDDLDALLDVLETMLRWLMTWRLATLVVTRIDDVVVLDDDQMDG